MFRKLDWWLLVPIAALLLVGVAMLYSLAGSNTQNLSWMYRQLVWVVIGAGVMLFTALIDYRAFRASAALVWFLYIGIWLLLALVLVFGKTISGNKAWFAIGPFTLQPVEFAKIALVLILARYFSEKNLEIWRMKHIVISCLITMGITGLVLLQPDTGSALLLATVWFCMLLASGVRVKHVLALGFIFCILVVAGWFWFFTENQKSRISALVFPTKDPLGAAYSQRQALIALGSGGLFGKGLGKGTQTQLGFLPAPRTDFIFSAIGEELGFVGIAIISICFGVLFWRLGWFALAAENNFVRLYAVGLMGVLFAQAAVHIAMNLGLIPVIGVGLPFVSYGGSSILALFWGFGMMQSMRLHG